MSNFLIYNAQKERIDTLQNFDSVQWMEVYQPTPESPGEVKIEAQATVNNISNLVEGNRIYNTDSNTVARIIHVDIVDSGSSVKITARAFLTAKLLDQRVVMGTERVTNVETGMYSIYSKNRRDLPIGISTAAGYSERTDTEITWHSVLDAEKTLAESSGLGFKVLFDPETGAETLKVYKGIDRSKETFAGYTGYFGADVDNVTNATATFGAADYKNVAIVAGAGEGSARTVRTVSLGNVSKENRRELYVDARDLQRTYQVATPTGETDKNGNPIYSYTDKTYTDAEYNALLDARGMEKLAEHLRTVSITCDIDQNNIQYGKDYSLGDRMPIKIASMNIKASARISKITMIYEKTGQKITAILSDFELEE